MMSYRYVSGVLQNDWNDPVDFRSLDRSQILPFYFRVCAFSIPRTRLSRSLEQANRRKDVIFELVWVIKRSILSFPVYITKKKVTSAIDSALLHWTMWLMVFPTNAGSGRCYLVSTRHEILSNIDRNLTGTRLRLRKNRNKINPARVRIPSQFYCCHLSLKQ